MSARAGWMNDPNGFSYYNRAGTDNKIGLSSLFLIGTGNVHMIRMTFEKDREYRFFILKVVKKFGKVLVGFGNGTKVWHFDSIYGALLNGIC